MTRGTRGTLENRIKFQGRGWSILFPIPSRIYQTRKTLKFFMHSHAGLMCNKIDATKSRKQSRDLEDFLADIGAAAAWRHGEKGKY